MSDQRLNQLKPAYDLIVVGGGIHGAALAWEATSRGLQVLLLEQHDFAGATSANSLKTIHGGIRYLQDFDFARMRSSINERKILLRIAPHLVTPLYCVMPTYRSALSKSKLALNIAIKIYDAVAWDRNRQQPSEQFIPRGNTLSLNEFNTLIPILDDPDISGGACWYDAQVLNSERLVLAFLMTAKEHGADVFNYLKCEDYLTDTDTRGVCGVLARDQLSGRQYEIAASAVVDCSGPWALHNKQLRPFLHAPAATTQARAFNLLIKQRLTPVALGFKTRSQNKSRLLFIAPWREGSMIGTWYAADDATPDDLSVSASEIEQALAEINNTLSIELTPEDISFVHCGLLPVSAVGSEQDEPLLQKQVQISHLHEKGGPAGLFCVQGVKYTTARAVAVETLKQVTKYFDKPLKPAISQHTALYGGDIGERKDFLKQCLSRYPCWLTNTTAERLLRNYGSKTGQILLYASTESNLAEPIPGVANSLQAELKFVLEQEMAFTLSDVLLRRTDIGSLAQPEVETIEFCSQWMSSHCGWDETIRQQNIDDLLKCYRHVPAKKSFLDSSLTQHLFAQEAIN